jgi:hypothetical protein
MEGMIEVSAKVPTGTPQKKKKKKKKQNLRTQGTVKEKKFFGSR